MMEACEVRYEHPDDTYQVVMEAFVNKNLDDITRKYLNEINQISIDKEEGYFFDGK